MFTFLKRISLFLITNLAVMALLGVVMLIIQYFFPNLLTRHGGMGSILIYAVIFGFGWAIVSLLLSRWQAKKSYNIQLLDGKSIYTEEVKLRIVYETVERIARDNSIDMPEVGYYESAEPNAFATGATKNKSLVAVSSWLLNAMKEDEIRWVIGHEMAHILNGDMVTLTLITGVLNAFVIVLSQVISRIIVSFLSRNDDGEGISYLSYMITYTILQSAFGLLASFIIMWFSRHREYRADLGGATYTGKSSMISALKKLQGMTKLEKSQHLDHGNLKAFMITEPDSFFSTHPSMDNRIKALEENYKLA
jgi:heat shock protein HtpX